MIQPEIVELNSSDSENEDEILPMPKIVEEIIDLDSEDYHQTHKKNNILRNLKNSDVYTPNFIKFVELCLRLQDNRDMRDILKVLIIPSYGCAEKTYINSTQFNAILLNNINHMEKHGNVSFTGIKRVVMNIKANRGNIVTYDLCDEEATVETLNKVIDLDTKLNKSQASKKAKTAKNNHNIELHNGDNSNIDISNLPTKLNKNKGLRKNNNTKSFKGVVLNNNFINNVIDLDKDLNNSEGLRKKNKSKILNEIKLNTCNNNTNVEINLNNSNNPNINKVIGLNTELKNSEDLKKKLKRPHELEVNNSNNSNINKVDSELNNSEDLNKTAGRLNEVKLNNTNNSNVGEVIDLDTELNNREDLNKKKKTKRLNKEESNNRNNSNINEVIDLNIELNNCEDLIKEKNLKRYNEIELKNTNNLNVNKVVDLVTEINNREYLNKTKVIDETELNNHDKSNDNTVLNLDSELNTSKDMKKINNMVQLDNSVTNLTKPNICDKVLYDLTANKNNNKLNESENVFNKIVHTTLNGDIHLNNGNNINQEQNMNKSEEFNKQIQILESRIKRCKENIQKFEEREVNFDKDSNSPYVLCDKLKLTLLRLYEELCALTNIVSYKQKKRPVIRLKVPEGHPPGPARHLEAWFNRPLKKDESLFPDFMDVINCVAAANVEDSLEWTPAKVLTEARSLFKQCGKQLQKRRQKREWRHLKKMLGDSPDPADLDPELEAKLQRNKIVADKRENEVVEFYCNAEKKFNERHRRIKLNDTGKVIENHTILTPIIPESKFDEIKENNIHHNDGAENKASCSNMELEIYNQPNYGNVYKANYCKIEIEMDNQYNDGNVYEDNFSKMEVEIDNKSNAGSVYKTNFGEEELESRHDNGDTCMEDSNKIEADNEINNDDDAYTEESEDSDIELIEESFVFIKDENDLLHVKKEEMSEEYLVKKEIKMESKSEVLSEKDVLSILLDIEKKSTNGLNIETQIIYEEPTVTIIFDSSDDSDVEDVL